jgi:hypothetical protein
VQPSALSQTVSISPAAVGTFAGNGTAEVADGVGAGASFKNPAGMHVAGGFGYVFDSGWLRKLNLTTGAVSTVAGTGAPGSVDNTDPMKATVAGSGPCQRRLNPDQGSTAEN